MFIEITQKTGQKVLVNVNNIDAILPEGGQMGNSVIITSSGWKVYCSEAVYEIYGKIEEESKYTAGSRASESHAF